MTLTAMVTKTSMKKNSEGNPQISFRLEEEEIAKIDYAREQLRIKTSVDLTPSGYAKLLTRQGISHIHIPRKVTVKKSTSDENDKTESKGE